MKKKRATIAPFLLFLCLVSLSSCYSSTAVKGTPIRELPPGSFHPSKSVIIMTPEQKAQIEQMSKVTENQVFTEAGGLPEYRIGPQDVLEVNSLVGDKRNTTTLTVNSRGTMSYSFLDDIEVAGLTPSQLDRLLTRKLSAYVRNPRIDILVKEFNSKTATIIGELSALRSTTTGKTQSGRTNLKGKTNLMDLIALAGGYTIDADIKNVKLIRKGKAFLLNVYDILEKGDETQNVIIDDGDVVNVPELPEFGERVYVMGEVNVQGIYALKDAKDLLGAISLAGSFTRLAKEENTLVVRGYEQGKKPLVMMADLNALLTKADLAQNVTLKDGDLVYVPRMVIGDINDWIANTMPLLDFLFYPNDFETRYSTRKYLHINRFQHE
ncbi:MAG: polysaccharide biosynthesis/export family protein [Pseudomonadota bacterium]